MTIAGDLVQTLATRGQSIAVAESLTGGLLASAFVDVPGASRVFAGGVVAYQQMQKTRQLGIDEDFLRERGTVDADVARLMAEGVRARFDSDFGLATTGVAGPERTEGKPVGTVYIGIATKSGTHSLMYGFDGDRHEIRSLAVSAALSGLTAILEEQS